MQGENGILGIGGLALPGKEDANLIDPAKNTIKAVKGASYFNSAESFAMIRGRHIGATFLGTMEVSQYGDIANFMIPGKLVKGMGGAMDLVGSAANVIVLTLHENKFGICKIMKECDLPLTGKGKVKKIITELGVWQISNEGLTLTDIAEEIDLEELRRRTPVDFKVSENLQRF